MKTYEQCLLCFERQATDVCAMSKLGKKQTEAVLTAVQSKIAAFPRDYPPIRMAIEIHDLVRSESGSSDPYSAIKGAANAVCRECVPMLMQHIAWSLDPLKTATQLAIAGNIIDAGAYGLRKLSRRILTDVIRDVLAQPLHGSSITNFNERINSANQILYIADNAGECFFDLPLLELMPGDNLTYAVRGGPVLNDATTEDAHAAGIQNRCRVIDTGDNAPGILPDRCSDTFRRAFESSDLIISKGQGNYESLSEITDKTIVFLTKVKCAVIAEDIGYPLDSNVIAICTPATNGGERRPNMSEHKEQTEVCHA